MSHRSSKAVLTALVANAVLTVLKFIAALLSHFASMMNGAIHSLMGSLNQGFLFIGMMARANCLWNHELLLNLPAGGFVWSRIQPTCRTSRQARIFGTESSG